LKIPLHNTSPASADGARKIGKYKESFIFNEREGKIINMSLKPGFALIQREKSTNT
jgi:hypothetical protein